MDAAPAGTVLGPIFTAEYESECSACQDPILPGEDARSDGTGQWIHADDQCEAVAMVTRRPARAVMSPCPLCFTYHAGECV